MNIKIEKNVQEAIAAAETEEEMIRGGCYNSRSEAWAELKIKLERASAVEKGIDKIHKEMWDFIRDGDDTGADARIHQMGKSIAELIVILVQTAGSCELHFAK